MAFISGDNNQLGLDIGTTSARLVQLKPGRGHPSLVTYGAVPLEQGTVMSDSDVSRRKLAKALGELFANSHATTRNVVVGLPSSKTYATVVDMLDMEKSKFEKSIRYQAEQHLPIPLEESEFGWIDTGDINEKKERQILLVATKLTLAETYLNTLEELSLNVVAIEPDSLGLTRALVTTDAATLLLNIGATSSDLVLVYKGVPRLIRSLSVGGESFLKSTMQSMAVEKDAAMQYVYQVGLDHTKLDAQIFNVLRSSVDTLINEINKSVKFFTEKYKDAPVEKIILSGGGSIVPEMPTYIANGTSLPVEVGNSWARISYSSKMQAQLFTISNQFTVAAGLATRGMLK